jgi:hypothetical protein
VSLPDLGRELTRVEKIRQLIGLARVARPERQKR